MTTAAPTATPAGRGLGYRKNPLRPEAPELRVDLAAPFSLPAVVDLRHQFLPVVDQGRFGTCTCCGVGAQVEQELARQRVPVPVHRSRLYPYFFSGEAEGSTADTGRDPRDVIAAIAAHGIPTEKDWPYTPDTLIGVLPSQQAQQAANRRHILSSYAVQPNPGAVMAALAAGYSIGIALPVYGSFEDQDVQQTGVVRLPRVGETLLGYHYVVIVGYTTIELPSLPVPIPANHLIVRNSWGPGFGQNGYIFLPFEWLSGISPDGQLLTQELLAVELVTQ